MQVIKFAQLRWECPIKTVAACAKNTRTKNALLRRERVTKTQQGNNDDYSPTSNPFRSDSLPSQVGIVPAIPLLAVRERNRK